jgi:DNA repair and recombination protein RAD54B
MQFQLKKRKQAELAALGAWTHINCLRPSAQDHIQDEILRELVCATDAVRLGPPKKQLVVDALLAASDLENPAALDAAASVTSVPGGTVSFIFEKVSSSTLDNADE